MLVNIPYIEHMGYVHLSDEILLYYYVLYIY